MTARFRIQTPEQADRFARATAAAIHRGTLIVVSADHTHGWGILMTSEHAGGER